MNLLQKLEMKLTKENNIRYLKILCTLTLIVSSNFLFSQDQIPAQNVSIESISRGILGMIFLIGIAYLFSAKKKDISWKLVGIGLTVQIIIAYGILKVQLIKQTFDFLGTVFVNIVENAKMGSQFLFGSLVNIDAHGFIFAIHALTVIIFLSALTSLLFYLGIIQKVVWCLAWIMTKFFNISGPESLSVAGNIFLGQTESPLLIKEYLKKMNKSEILLVMIGGMATVAGSVLGAYIDFLGGDDPVLKAFYARHLLAASVMAAPGAVVISKILYPQTKKISKKIIISNDRLGSNIFDAMSIGTTQGLKLALNVGAMLIVFIAMLSFINSQILFPFGKVTGLNEYIQGNTIYSNFSLEFILGNIFSPLMWVLGIAKEDIHQIGQLLGIKLVATEFVAYQQLSILKNISNVPSITYQKSVLMATYMLCGFANFASIGVQIGGIGSLEPSKIKILSRFGMRALLGGTLASLTSATIAGIIIG